MKKKLLILLLSILFVVTLSSCEKLENIFGIKKTYKISFYSDNILIFDDVLPEGSLLEEQTIEKEGFDLIGWYKDVNDDNSIWDFNKDTLIGNTRLDAKWKLKEKFLFINNVRIDDTYLYYDVEPDSEVTISFLDKIITSNTDHINLIEYKDLLLAEVEFSIIGIKEGYTSVENKVKIQYNLGDVFESELIDFEAFDYNDFKELNRSTFKTSLIDDDDFHLYVKEARLTNVNETFKENEVALILRENGELHLKNYYKNFVNMSFSIASYRNRTTNSTLNLLVSNDLYTWYEVKQYNTFNNVENKFNNINVTKEDLPNELNLDDKLYFKFIANIDKENIIVDDISVFEISSPSFILTQVSEDNFELSDYYKSVSGLKDKDLIEELRLIVSTNLNPVKYKDIKEILEFSDASLNDNSKVIGIYDRQLYRANWGTSSQWHREHVWPNSRLGMDRVKENEVNQGSDPHNLRAIKPSVNSSRSNRYYDVKVDQNNIYGHTLADGAYYPGDEDKGDVARILMYMVIRYEILNLTNHIILLQNKAYTQEAAYMGLLKNLLTWHKSDPVDEFEVRRNEVIYEYQNNRNPFIDHPALFELVYNYLIETDNLLKVYADYEIVLYIEENKYQDIIKKM